MAKISKFLQVNEKLLLEYTYDINASADGKNLDAYVFKDNAGRLTFYNNPTEDNIGRYYASGFMFTSFPKGLGDEEYRYSGFVSSPNTEEAVLPLTNIDPKIEESLGQNGYIQRTEDGEWFYSKSDKVDVVMEKVRVYIASGYTFNDCLGFVLNVQTYQSANSKHKSNGGVVNLGTFTFFKSMMSFMVKFVKKPFFLQSKFYDRYIDFYIPSAFYMALHKSKGNVENEDGGENGEKENDSPKEVENDGIFDTLNIEYGNQVLFNFASIETDNFEQIEFGDDGYINFFENKDSDIYSDKIFYNQGEFRIADFLTAQITLNSNSDNFNLRIYEDKESNCIRYYPVWGDPSQDNPLTRKIMNSIENGSIPLSIKGFYDENDTDLDNFEEIYGEDSRKWIVVNQLEIQFVYQPMVSSPYETDNEIILTRKFNYTEDFDTDNDSVGNIDNIYKYVYRPVIESLNNGYICNYIAVTYTGRLVNRLNGEEIIRTATLDIENAESKFGINSHKIDVSNIYTWKLFNKFENTDVNVKGIGNGVGQTKYITKFIDSQNFAMRDEQGNRGMSGDFTIRLYDTSHLYKMRVFTDDTYSEAYQFGNANVSLLMRVSSGSDNTPVYLKPLYSSEMNSVAGELVFRITEEMASKIFKGNKKWFIVAQTEQGVTTLFAGKFISVFGEDE